jgi:LysM repeat protein
MLPTNPQALTATDRAVLDNLKQQGEQIDRQTKVLETLVDKVTRQMRSDEKLEKNDKKNQVKGDTAVKDIPGMAFDKLSDSLNDFIVKRFNSIKDKFKEEKSKPAEKQEAAKQEKEPKEDKVNDNPDEPVYHVVKEKETMYSISRKYNVDQEEIRKLNEERRMKKSEDLIKIH